MAGWLRSNSSLCKAEGTRESVKRYKFRLLSNTWLWNTFRRESAKNSHRRHGKVHFALFLSAVWRNWLSIAISCPTGFVLRLPAILTCSQAETDRQSFLQTHVPFPHLTVMTLIYLTCISPCLALVAAAHVFPRFGTVVRLQVFPGMEPLPSFFYSAYLRFCFY